MVSLLGAAAYRFSPTEDGNRDCSILRNEATRHIVESSVLLRQESFLTKDKGVNPRPEQPRGASACAHITAELPRDGTARPAGAAAPGEDEALVRSLPKLLLHHS